MNFMDYQEFPSLIHFENIRRKLVGAMPVPPVLIVMHPADAQEIHTIGSQHGPSPLPGPPTIMGYLCWTSPKIERDKVRMYYSWEAAHDDLKDLLEKKDVLKLKAMAKSEKQRALSLEARF